jgi:methyl-accepting chemotaxis protein
VDAVTKAATRAVALGEIGRTCDAQLDRDRTAIRDIQKRTADAANEKIGFETEVQDARTRVTAARGINPAANEARTAFNAATAKVSNVSRLIQQLSADLQTQTEDLRKQQDCADKARKQLADLFNSTATPTRGSAPPQK